MGAFCIDMTDSLPASVESCVTPPARSRKGNNGPQIRSHALKPPEIGYDNSKEAP